MIEAEAVSRLGLTVTPQNQNGPDNATKPEEQEGSGPLDRHIQVLEVISAFPGAVTLSDVGAILGLPKTTAHRLLKGLVRAGLATSSLGGRAYQPGERLIRLLHASAEDGWLEPLARPHLRELSESTSETCYLTRLKGARVVVALSHSPDVRWRSYVQTGIEMPIHAAAACKAVMAFQDEKIVRQAMAGELPLLTENTRNDEAWIAGELAQVRRRGYATCIGEIDEGLAALAVPIRTEDGATYYSLGMTGPLQRIMNDQMPERLKALGRTAEALGRALLVGRRIVAKSGG